MSLRRAACRASVLLAMFSAGCASRHSTESALAPAGPQAQRLANLFWLFLAVSVVVWIVVMAFVTLALRRSQKTVDEPMLNPEPRRERRIEVAISTSVGITVLALLLLLVGEFSTARATHLFGESAKNQVSITVTGHQWWWEIQYQDSTPSNWITSANELVIPVGRPIGIKLQSQDVIHSFWIPNLNGKKDLVPGHPATLWLQADEPGVYWGECAEFCGFQHAQMRLVAKAVSPSEFDAWLARSRQTAATPSNPSQQRGQQVFLSSSCVTCHQISGVHAFGRVGPDLSHVGSRTILAAGALEHTRDNLVKWIADPQAIKPGTQMPQIRLAPDNLQALVDYLESLK